MRRVTLLNGMAHKYIVVLVSLTLQLATSVVTATQDCWDKTKFPEIQEYAKKIGSSSFLALEKGRPVVSAGPTDEKHDVKSVRKSLLNSLFGIAVNKNQIKLNSSMAELKIDDKVPLTSTEKRATVENLLTSRSGIYLKAAKETDQMEEMRPKRGEHLPGSFYYYNNWDFNVLGAIYEKATSKRIGQAFKEQIADKIGMVDFVPSDVEYSYHRASTYPAYTFKMTARDMAQYGQLMLNRGKFKGESIVPEAWIEKSTAPISERLDGDGSFGMMWHVYKPEIGLFGIKNVGQTFAAHGHGGHFIEVIPKLQMVFINQSKPPDRVSKKELGRLISLVLDANQCQQTHEPPKSRERQN